MDIDDNIDQTVFRLIDPSVVGVQQPLRRCRHGPLQRTRLVTDHPWMISVHNGRDGLVVRSLIVQPLSSRQRIPPVIAAERPI